MMNCKATQVKQEMSNDRPCQQEYAVLKSHILPMGHSSSQTGIKQEPEDALLAKIDDNVLPCQTIASLACQVKTEPSSGDEQECEQNTLVHHPLDIAVMAKDVNRVMNTSEDAGADINDQKIASSHKALANSENGELIIPDVDMSEQDSMSDTSEEMDKQQQCWQVDKESKAFQKHIKMLSQANKTGRTCSVCGKDFDTSQTCLRHMWESHTGEKPYTCQLCGKAVKTLYEFKCHKITHSNERPYSCDVCEKTFKRKAILQKHKAACHSDERPYSCNQCDKTFKKKAHVQDHIISCHSDERPYGCELCEKTFKQKYNLQLHIGTCHSDKRPFSCDICEKTFKRKEILQLHKTTCHSDERPFSCDECEKTFKRKSHLQQHKASCHSDARPYACDVCDKTFKVKAYVQLHKATCHSSERPYSCDQCAKTFKRKSILQEHKAACH